MNCLLLGCGNSRAKKIRVNGNPRWDALTTVDMDPASQPDITHDLESYPWPIDGEYDEIHAYEVLEHLGQQGDYKQFFAFFSEIYRLLKPGGYFACSVPNPDSAWAWADPGHRRLITIEQMVFLSQEEYRKQVGVTTMTDYRWLWKGDLRLTWQRKDTSNLWFTLQRPE